MIRTALIVALTLASAMLAAAWIASCAHVRIYHRWLLQDGYVEFAVTGGEIVIAEWSREPSPSELLKALGFRTLMMHSFNKPGLYAHALFVPVWPLLLLSGAYPAFVALRAPMKRRYRRRRGLCVKCGYNLTGNVSGACPECGTRVEQR